jgi:hypothetical protein
MLGVVDFGRLRRCIWVHYFWKHRRNTTNCNNDYSIRYWIDCGLSGPQNAKDCDYCCDYIGCGCLLWVFRFKSWRLERHCRRIWSYSNTIRGSSHGYATARLRARRWFCYRLRIILNKNFFPTVKLLEINECR